MSRVPIPDDLACRRIRAAIERSLKTMRTCGSVDVEIDLEFAIYVRFTPFELEPHAERCWSRVTDPTSMWIDPEGLVVPKLRALEETAA